MGRKAIAMIRAVLRPLQNTWTMHSNCNAIEMRKKCVLLDLRDF